MLSVYTEKGLLIIYNNDIVYPNADAHAADKDYTKKQRYTMKRIAVVPFMKEKAQLTSSSM